LVIDDDAELLGMIRLLLERRGGHETILSPDASDGLAKAREDPPDLAIVDVMMPSMTGYEVCRRLREYPETASMPILVLTARGQAVDRQAALDAGADEHVAKPVAMTDLLERVNELLEERPTARTSQVIALLSLRGGVGVTTLAVNLAATLVQKEPGNVCLVDLCHSSGHVALQFGLRPDPDWSDLLQEGALDAEAVKACLLEHASGLQLLASPFVPLVREELPRATVETLLTGLQQRFDDIVVDTPPALNAVTMAALDAASDTWLVVAPETASIQTTLGAIRAFGERSDQLRVIVNQPTRQRRTSPDAIEGLLKRPVAGTVPFDEGQAEALAQGRPLALSNPDSPLAAAVERLATELI
jgi:pilus assembly protein CpaE